MMLFFRDVTYKTLVSLYRNYFYDFVAFGYTPDEYFRFSRKFEDNTDELTYLRQKAAQSFNCKARNKRCQN